MNMSTGEVAHEQPYIHRLTRLGAAAAALGEGLPFLAAVSAVIFGGVRDWHLGGHLPPRRSAQGWTSRNSIRKSSAIQIVMSCDRRK